MQQVDQVRTILPDAPIGLPVRGLTPALPGASVRAMTGPTRETIFALSSGRPPAAIAVVRVSGARAGAALKALTGKVPDPRKAALAHWIRGWWGAAKLMVTPGRELLGALGDYQKTHVCVFGAAKFCALALEHAGVVRANHE